MNFQFTYSDILDRVADWISNSCENVIRYSGDDPRTRLNSCFWSTSTISITPTQTYKGTPIPDDPYIIVYYGCPKRAQLQRYTPTGSLGDPTTIRFTPDQSTLIDVSKHTASSVKQNLYDYVNSNFNIYSSVSINGIYSISQLIINFCISRVLYCTSIIKRNSSGNAETCSDRPLVYINNLIKESFNNYSDDLIKFNSVDDLYHKLIYIVKINTKITKIFHTVSVVSGYSFSAGVSNNSNLVNDIHNKYEWKTISKIVGNNNKILELYNRKKQFADITLELSVGNTYSLPIASEYYVGKYACILLSSDNLLSSEVWQYEELLGGIFF